MTPTITPEAARLVEERQRFEAEAIARTWAYRSEHGLRFYPSHDGGGDLWKGWLAAKQDAAPTSAACEVAEALADLRRTLGTEEWNGVGGWCEAVDSVRHELAVRIDKARAAPTSASTVQEWLPIETAPKDGTAIYVIVADAKVPEAGVAHWANGTWRGDSAQDWEGASDAIGHFGIYPSPTHWQPLPKPPGACSVTDGEAKK